MRKQYNSKSSGSRPDQKRSNAPKGGYKGASKTKRFVKEDDKYGATESGNNDPAWYGANSELLRDACSIPYSWAVGTPIDLQNPLNATAIDRKITIPGIQTIKLMPSVGASVDPSSPINIASNANYTFVRHENSGSSNYDAPDLMMYIMAMTQVYSYICFLQRCYGIATLFAQKNRYLPTALLKAAGVDAEAIQSNLADFRYNINVLINKAASFAVPNTMPIFNRQAFIYSNLYTEGESIKDQLYQYAPASFWKFEWDAVTSKSKLVAVPFTAANGASVSALIAYGNDMLSRLIYDEEINIMSGDILKAYGADRVIKLAPLTTDFPIVPIYNLEVLEQMKNATIVRADVFTGAGLEQDPTNGWLLHQIIARNTGEGVSTPWMKDAIIKGFASLVGNRLITTQANDVTPEQTMENTRLVTVSNHFQNNGSDSYCPLWTGSEVAVACEWTYFAVSTTNGIDTVSYAYKYGQYADVFLCTTDAIQTASETNTVLQSNHFKFKPAQYMQFFKQTGATAAGEFVTSMLSWDVDNYAVLTFQDVARMHEAAIMNELFVPYSRKLTR
jgi:hypothetical protein